VRSAGTAAVTGSRRVFSCLVATLLLAVLAVVGCGSGRAGAATGTAAPVVTADGAQRVDVTFAGGEVTGGIKRYAVPIGSSVELVVASDVADAVHLHGYDRMTYVTAGATTTLRFVANLPGVFEVEMENRRILLAQLQIA
jgi:heme/copper-type cytochrome/quinol oxidase subunit 2